MTLLNCLIATYICVVDLVRVSVPVSSRKMRGWTPYFISNDSVYCMQGKTQNLYKRHLFLNRESDCICCYSMYVNIACYNVDPPHLEE